LKWNIFENHKLVAAMQQHWGAILILRVWKGRIDLFDTSFAMVTNNQITSFNTTNVRRNTHNWKISSKRVFFPRS